MPHEPASRQQLELFDFSSLEELPPVPRAVRREAVPPLRPVPNGADERLTEQCRQWVEALGHEELALKIRVIWNAKLRTTAGRAYRQTQLIELNPQLVEVSEEEVDRTVRHELAHLVAYYRAGRKRIQPHGREWQRACADLGIAGEARCHELPFERTQQQRRFAYECPHCNHALYRVRRIRRAAACYDCCRKFSRGRFDARFQLAERPLRPGDGPASK